MDCPKEDMCPTKCRIQDSRAEKHWAGKAELLGVLCGLAAQPKWSPARRRAAVCAGGCALAGGSS